MSLTKGIHIAIINLVIVAIVGCFLRYLFLQPVSWINYSYVLHAHSHLAFLGWVFMALYVLLVYAYLPSGFLKSEKFLIIFGVLQLANLGMLVTFPFMGYALWSIVFSALHAITAMIFAWIFIKEASPRCSLEHKMSFLFVKSALVLMVLSNLAPFALGPISATQGKSDLYYLLIYFYLHFQYNGWFTFALLGLTLWQLEEMGVNTKSRSVKVGFILKLVAVFPAYILSALWTEPDLIWYVVGGLSAAVQLVGLASVGYFVIQNRKALSLQHSSILRVLFWMGMLAVGLQHVLMLLSALPALANLAFARNIVIAYLHMVLLGFVTAWLFFILVKLQVIQLTLSAKAGFWLFLVALVATELALVFQGHIVHSTHVLFCLALVQLCGVVSIAFNVKGLKLSL
ncbi:MAG: hypothetical protein ABJN36_16000 [Cyclobacteriaceae bacterium]